MKSVERMVTGNMLDFVGKADTNENIGYFLHVANMPTSDLMKLKKSTLVYVSDFFGGNITGNKNEIVHSICENASIYNVSGIDETYNSLCFHVSEQRKALEYIANTGIHTILAKAIVKSIAVKGIDENGNIKNDCYMACSQLYDNHFNETIMEDIEQSIYMAIHSLMIKGLISIKSGFPHFWNYANGTNAYVFLFKALRKCLATYKNTDSSRAKCGLYTIVYDSEGNEHLVGETSTQYIVRTAEISNIDDILESVNLLDFINHLKKTFPRKWDKMVNIIYGMISGMTEVQIAETYGYSRSTVQRMKEMFRVEHEVFINKKPVAIPENTGKTKKHSFTSSYSFSYGDITPMHFEKPARVHGFCVGGGNIDANKDADKIRDKYRIMRHDYTGERVQICKVDGGVMTVVNGNVRFVPYAPKTTPKK